MAYSNITIEDLYENCRKAVENQVRESRGFSLSAKQVFFFVLIQLQKEGFALTERKNLVPGKADAELTESVVRTTRQLSSWGTVVDGLKNRVDKEWILFLFQMENAVRNYAVSDDIKADAVQEAAMKVLELLKKLPTFAELDQIDAIDEIVMWIVDGKSRYGNVYHFGSPFYAFTKTIVRFQLIDMIRRERNTNKITVQLEEIENDLYSNLTVSSPDEPERVVLAQLRKDLVNLLKLIDQVLKSKPRIVIIETLVARPQFWRVLKETNLSAPANYLPDSGVQSDAEIVRKLEITVSNLRAQRSQSLRRISAKDAILGELLKRLIAARGRG